MAGPHLPFPPDRLELDPVLAVLDISALTILEAILSWFNLRDHPRTIQAIDAGRSVRFGATFQASSATAKESRTTLRRRP